MPDRPLPLRASFLIHITFVLTGMVNTLLGPMLPWLAARWGLQHADAGILFTAQFSGSIVGALVLSRVGPRWGYPVTLVAGLACMAAGVTALALSAWPWALAAGFAYGIGLGLTIPAANLLVAETSPNRAAGAVSLLNAAWGIGAVLWPPMVAMAGDANAVHLLLVLAASLVVSAVVYARAGMPKGSSPALRAVRLAAPESASNAFSSQFLFYLGALFFLYVGTETALAGWSAAYAQSLSGPSSHAWTVTPTFFWAPLLIGRLLAPAVLRYASETVVFRFALLLAVVGLASLQAVVRPGAVMVAMSLIGLSLAPIFPILMAWLSRAFGRDTARIGGLMFALCGLGGATLPWLVGVVSSWLVSMRAGLAATLLSTALLLALDLTMPRHPTPKPKSN